MGQEVLQAVVEVRWKGAGKGFENLCGVGCSREIGESKGGYQGHRITVLRIGGIWWSEAYSSVL